MSTNNNVIKIETNKLFGIDIVYFKTFASSLIALFLFIMTGIAVVIPKMNEIGEMNDKVAAIDKEAKGVADKIKYLSSIDQNVLTNNENVMLQAIPDVKDVYYLMTVVRQVAAAQGYVVDSFNVSPGLVSEDGVKENKAGVSKTPLGVVLIGPYDKYLDLLAGFENALPIMSLDQFALKPLGQLAELNLKIGTYSSNRQKTSTKEPSLSEVQLGDKEKALIEKLASYTRIEIASGSALLNNMDVGETKIDPFNL